MKINRENKFIIASFFSLLILGMVVSGVQHYFIFSVMQSDIYASMCIIWMILNKRRIVQKYIGWLLVGIGGLLFFLFMQQLIKYRCLYSQSVLIRYIVYSYQVTIIAVVLLSFFASLCLGKDTEDKPFGCFAWLILPFVLISAGFFTNEIHQLAYKIYDPGCMVKADGNLGKHGIICYIGWAWQIVLLIATFVVTIYRCRILHMRKYAWIPFAFLSIGFVYFTIYVANGGHGINIFNYIEIQFQDAYAFMIIGFWESCIQIGLIPSNSEYETIFHHSSINSKITNNKNVTIYCSENADMIDVSVMENDDKEMVLIDDNTRLHKKDIRGGRVYWTDDISEINIINEELTDIAEQLSGGNFIIKRENEIKEEKAKYEAQNTMYDNLATVLSHTIENIEKLLSEIDEKNKFEELMKQVSLYGTFIKRKANLYLLTEQNERIRLFDLYLSIKESIEYLNLSQISGNIWMENDGDISGKTVMTAYDYFEYVLELAMPDLKAVLVNLTLEKANEGKKNNHEFRMNIVLESPSAILENIRDIEHMKEMGVKISIEKDEESVYVIFDSEG